MNSTPFSLSLYPCSLIFFFKFGKYVDDFQSSRFAALGSAIAKRYSLSSEVVIIGVLDHFEIWDKTSYEEYQKKNEDSYEKIAEDLSNLSKEEN